MVAPLQSKTQVVEDLASLKKDIRIIKSQVTTADLPGLKDQFDETKPGSLRAKVNEVSQTVTNADLPGLKDQFDETKPGSLLAKVNEVSQTVTNADLPGLKDQFDGTKQGSLMAKINFIGGFVIDKEKSVNFVGDKFQFIDNPQEFIQKYTWTEKADSLYSQVKKAYPAQDPKIIRELVHDMITLHSWQR